MLAAFLFVCKKISLIIFASSITVLGSLLWIVCFKLYLLAVGRTISQPSAESSWSICLLSSWYWICMCCYFMCCVYNSCFPCTTKLLTPDLFSGHCLFIDVLITAFVNLIYWLHDDNVCIQVQGMSFVAAVLLLNTDVYDAFTCFANLLNRPCQNAFFRLDKNLVCISILFVC